MKELDPKRFALENVVTCVKSKSLLNCIRKMGASRSIWLLPFGTSCCYLEYLAALGPRYDFLGINERLEVASPGHADLLIVAGTINEKMAPVLKNIYDQMLSPKWVLAVGACASSGGIYRDSNVVQGIGEEIPVDVYVPGCPPTPEALIDGILKIKEKIRKCGVHGR